MATLNKISPNMHKVVVYLYNPARKGCSTGKGSKDFKTTHSFKGIKTYEEALEIVNQFGESRDMTMNYSMIKKAYYNGKLLVLDGKWISSFAFLHYKNKL